MMFQPRVKLEFIRRYCNPATGWKVFVDIDPSEEGRTGGERQTDEARRRQLAMREDAETVRERLRALDVTVGGSRRDWHLSCELPLIDHGDRVIDHGDRVIDHGDRDIVAVHNRMRSYLIAEVEGASSGQPEQKLYKAIGQVVLAASQPICKGWSRTLCVVVHGESIAGKLRSAKALAQLGVAALHLTPIVRKDEWLFGQPLKLYKDGDS
jgi:hypothetical protein